MATQQQIENRAKWIAALRSGDYAQDKGQLCTLKGYCCLGVAAETFAINRDGNTYVFPSGAVQTSYINREWFFETFGALRNEATLGALMKMNDEENRSFSEIAEYIESEGIWAD